MLWGTLGKNIKDIYIVVYWLVSNRTLSIYVTKFTYERGTAWVRLVLSHFGHNRFCKLGMVWAWAQTQDHTIMINEFSLNKKYFFLLFLESFLQRNSPVPASKRYFSQNGFCGLNCKILFLWKTHSGFLILSVFILSPY